jgi:hypothetical protein
VFVRCESFRVADVTDIKNLPTLFLDVLEDAAQGNAGIFLLARYYSSNYSLNKAQFAGSAQLRLVTNENKHEFVYYSAALTLQVLRNS